MDPKDAAADPLTEWEGEPLLECDDLLYVLTVTNSTTMPLKYRIFFKETSITANLVYPHEGLVGEIAASEASKVVAVLPRITPFSTRDVSMDLTEIEKLTVALLAEVD